MTTHRNALLSILLAAFFVIGCGAAQTAVRTAVDRAATQTGAQVGDAVGQRMGQMASAMIMARFPDSWTTQWRTLYVNYLFGVAFHSGSYTVVEDAYRPGDWTQWQMVFDSDPTGAVVERAFLSRTDDGNEWWRVKYVSTEEDESIVLEGLFDLEQGEMVRLRAKFPGEEAQEMPVREGTIAYVAPITLTEQSLEGATVGRESITVPAGTFDTRHIRYGAGGSTLEWWLDEGVPGNMVKYLRRSAGGEGEEEMPDSWTVQLLAYGSDARPELL